MEGNGFRRAWIISLSPFINIRSSKILRELESSNSKRDSVRMKQQRKLLLSPGMLI